MQHVHLADLRASNLYHLQLYVHRYGERDVQVNWRPPQTYLHYPALYRGVYEFLREPPDRRHFLRTWRYLRALKKCYHPDNILQRHRILWTQAWLDQLDDPEDSGAETVPSE